MMTTYTATERRSHLLAAVSHGGSYGMKNLTATVEFAAATTLNRTINFGYIPSNARILGSSRVHYDDLSNAGAPTLDIGLGAVNGNLANADDPDAINDGLALSTAASDIMAISNIANIGLPAWDLVASEASDPGGELMVYGTVADAATTVVGTITLEMNYVVD
jgi:hypothetical protein